MIPLRYNLRDGLPPNLPDEFSEVLAQGRNVRIERIVSRGHTSGPDFWYDQNEDEFVLLIAGRARLEFAGYLTPIPLEPSDWLLIPAHCRHRVAWTDPQTDTLWLAVFLG
jgi:cupin 2 domain-containing protein